MRFFASFLIAVVCLNVQARDFGPNLINGQPITDGSFDQVVRIKTDGAGCTATIVGPHVIVTAAHCGNTGAESKFTYDGKDYSAKVTRSPLFPNLDHDIAVGIVTEEIVGVDPISVGGSATIGDDILLLGYGCINPGGGGGNDGILRAGESVITSFTGFDMVSSTPSGAALCYGDSGGPAMTETDDGLRLLGINSKGNILDTNYNARLDKKESIDFLKKMATDNKVDICGVNVKC